MNFTNMQKYTIIIMEPHKKAVNDLLEKNKNIIFDIDWQGTQQLVKFSNLKFLKIFLLPPKKTN